MYLIAELKAQSFLLNWNCQGYSTCYVWRKRYRFQLQTNINS